MSYLILKDSNDLTSSKNLKASRKDSKSNSASSLESPIQVLIKKALSKMADQFPVNLPGYSSKELLVLSINITFLKSVSTNEMSLATPLPVFLQS